MKAEGEELLRFVGDWIHRVVVRPPMSCQLTLWFLCRPLPREQEAGRMAELWRSHKNPILSQHFFFFLIMCRVASLS